MAAHTLRLPLFELAAKRGEPPTAGAPAAAHALRLPLFELGAKRGEPPTLLHCAPARLKLRHGVVVTRVATDVNGDRQVDDVAAPLLLREAQHCVRHQLLGLRSRAFSVDPRVVHARC